MIDNVPGVVSRIIPFSCVDGPGNRFVVFLQGCNFHCLSCHNPHTINRCNHCGDCVGQCPSGALSMQQGRVVWNSALCQQCDQCIDGCPRSSSPMTVSMSVAQIITQLEQAAAFLTGVTVSGGESTMQLKFIRALFTAIKAHAGLQRLTCLVDSNGYLPVSAWETLVPVMDGAMIDLKAIDPTLHRRLTGKDNGRVMASIKYLYDCDRLTEIRWLAIPGINDGEQEVVALRQWLAENTPNTPLRINAFSNKAVKGEAVSWPSLTRADADDLRQLLTIGNAC